MVPGRGVSLLFVQQTHNTSEPDAFATSIVWYRTRAAQELHISLRGHLQYHAWDLLRFVASLGFFGNFFKTFWRAVLLFYLRVYYFPLLSSDVRDLVNGFQSFEIFFKYFINIWCSGELHTLLHSIIFLSFSILSFSSRYSFFLSFYSQCRVHNVDKIL